MRNIVKKIVKIIMGKFGFLCYENNDLYSLDKYLDYDEFRYIMMVYQTYKKIELVPGHIIELGVARGRNTILFGNLIKSYNDNSRRYYGFDTFSGYTDEDLRYNDNLDKSSWKNDYDFVCGRVNNSGYQQICNIIKGDIKSTIPIFITDNPDIKIAMIYIDCNAYLPASKALEALRSNLMPGAVICIDEKRDGGETRALREFAEKHKLQIIKDQEPFCLPAYIKV